MKTPQQIIDQLTGAYEQSLRDYHNYQDWDQEQWDRIAEAERQAIADIQELIKQQEVASD